MTAEAAAKKALRDMGGYELDRVASALGMPFTLDTDRLLLREMSPADLDFVAAMLADSQVMRFFPQRYSREESARWIERQVDRYRRDGHGLWLVCGA